MGRLFSADVDRGRGSYVYSAIVSYSLYMYYQQTQGSPQADSVALSLPRDALYLSLQRYPSATCAPCERATPFRYPAIARMANAIASRQLCARSAKLRPNTQWLASVPGPGMAFRRSTRRYAIPRGIGTTPRSFALTHNDTNMSQQ